MLDGVVYRAAHDGTIQIVKDSETIPFSNGTYDYHTNSFLVLRESHIVSDDSFSFLNE